MSNVHQAYKRLCEACANLGECFLTFSAYWRLKSHGGVGCNYPFAYSDRFVGERYNREYREAKAHERAAVAEFKAAEAAKPTRRIKYDKDGQGRLF